jgi:uncharacterized protein YciI
LAAAPPFTPILLTLAFAVIAVIFVRGQNWDPSRKLVDQEGLQGHIDFIRRSRDQGVVIEAGPFHDQDTYVTDDLVGLALLSFDSLATAREFIDAESDRRDRRFAYRLYPWGGGGPPLRRMRLPA